MFYLFILFINVLGIPELNFVLEIFKIISANFYLLRNFFSEFKWPTSFSFEIACMVIATLIRDLKKSGHHTFGEVDCYKARLVAQGHN